jgi:alpha-D-xyloside xylohydrolase
MFGPAFLVNPVTQQLYTAKNAPPNKSRKVYLPAAAKWYNFWTGEVLEGGQTIDAPAPIDIMPLYVKAGSIIPMGPEIEYATAKQDAPIELRIYPGANGTFKFYEDENDNYDYEKGRYATFTLSWNEKEHKLSISDTRGQFPGMLKQRTFNVVLVNGEHGANTGVTQNADKEIKYTGKKMELVL